MHDDDSNIEWRTLVDSSASPIRWSDVRRVLVVRLRSIGDTVLATPALAALRRFLPEAQIDVLLEDWVAPLLLAHEGVDNVISVKRDGTMNRLQVVRHLRNERYDVVFNLHGGTTATFLTRATGAPHRIGFANYQYGFLHNHVAAPAAEIWNKTPIHSVEQQLALVASVGVPVSDKIPTRLTITKEAAASVYVKLQQQGINANDSFALIHPAAAFDTKQWATENFARVVEHLNERGLMCVALATKSEQATLEVLRASARVQIVTFDDLSLPEVTALAARARLFVGNDSGVAHIASAVGVPSVVIFGSSNIAHWRPWTPGGEVSTEIVREELPCQPCAGYVCREFAQPECIRRVTVEKVMISINRVLEKSAPSSLIKTKENHVAVVAQLLHA